MRAAYASEVFRRNRAIGLDGHGQLVVVEDLTFAGIFDFVGDLANWRIEAVDRNEANWRILRTIALCRHIAFAGVDREFHADLGALIECAEDKVGVEHDHIADSLNVAGCNSARPLLFDDHAFRTLALHLDGDVLDIEHHVGDVLAHACDRGKLVQHAIDMHRLHRRTLQGGQQNASQRVAERNAEAALERFGNHRGNPCGVTTDGHLELVRPDQFLPILLDHVFTFSAARPSRA